MFVDVENIHARIFLALPAEVGSLIDQLASSNDRLWPNERWPAMRFDTPLGVGAAGGHGPIKYCIETYDPGRRIVFRFTSPKGFDGTHGFEILSAGQGTRLRHFVRMRLRGTARVTWPMAVRPLHEALIEDALDKAESSLGFTPAPRRWPLTARLLRRALRRVQS